MAKILYLSLLCFCISLSTFGQLTETEPNDPYLSGNLVPENTTMTGQTCIWNEPDYYQIILPEDGILRVHMSAAGEGTNPSSTTFGITLFNANEEAWNSYNSIAGENGAALETENGWCCLEAGTYYVQMYTSYVYEYCYTYTFSWELIPTAFANDSEPNSTFQTAQDLDYNTEEDGHLAFLYHPQGGEDNYDYYRIEVPFSGTLRLYIDHEGQSTGSETLTVGIHTSDGAAWYTQTTPTAVYPALTQDTLIWECIASETMYLSLYTTNYYDRGYSYRIRYDVEPMIYENDIEPNNTFATAQLVDSSLPIEGNSYLGNGYYWANTSEDFFKFTKPEDGYLELKVFSETHTENSTGGNVVQLYDANSNPIGSPFTAPIGTLSIPEVDSISFASLPAGDYFIQTYSPYAYAGCRSYNIIISFSEFETNVNELSKNLISLYPNPNNGQFSLNTSTLSGIGQVRIIDLLGRKVFEENIILGSTTNLQVSALKKGGYILEIMNETTKIQEPFIVNQ
jgi:hypothetical protein